jgi:hypothetical protein
MDLALGTATAKDITLKAVSRSVGELHQLETRLARGSAGYNERMGSIHALEERLEKLREQ